MSAGDKWAIVTGASSGIGRAIALEFAAGGFNVFLTGRNETALERVAAECAKANVKTEIAAVDLSCLEGIDQLITALTAKPYRYEVLANNAGFGIHGKFAETDIVEEQQLLNVQLSAALKLTKAVLPAMISRGSGDRSSRAAAKAA